MPHNDILNDPEINKVFKDYIEANASSESEVLRMIPLEKEPDYVFVVNPKRKDVLTSQLEEINNDYEKSKRDMSTNFGLLHGERKYLDYMCYPHT